MECVELAPAFSDHPTPYDPALPDQQAGRTLPQSGTGAQFVRSTRQLAWSTTTALPFQYHAPASAQLLVDAPEAEKYHRLMTYFKATNMKPITCQARERDWLL